MRDEIDLADQRLSRLSRVAVLVATIGVAVITVWVFVPILLANRTTSTPTLAAAPNSRAVVQEPSAPVVAVATAPSRSVGPPPTAVAPVPAAPATVPADTDTAAQRDEAAAAPALAAAAPTPPPASLGTAAAVPWPIAGPAASLPPAAPTPNMQLASAPPAEAADAVETVPLPRSRPSRMIAARLTIPLPRPRPQIASDGPTPEQAAFERQVERMR